MRKTYSLAYLFIILLVGLFVGCKKSPGPSVTERIAKVWTASRVDENNSPVYVRGGTNNIRPAYTSWKLDLSAPPTVKYTEWDGSTFSGQYTVTNDNTLTLTGLTPVPTGTGGTITFTINSIDDGNLKLTNNSTSLKTGGTTNVYTLTNP